MMYELIKPFLFSQDSESVHDRLLDLMNRYPLLARTAVMNTQKKESQFNSTFGWKNQIGLAAGFDKNAVALDFLDNLGFGAIEVGTVTPKPQWGNDKKRIHRLKNEKALVNWMGFPSEGSTAVKKRIESYSGSASLGINIGKNKVTPNSKAIDDYSYLFSEFHNICDYMVVNISSPNTTGLRDLQNKEFLNELCFELKKIKSLDKLCVKFAPDFNFNDLVGIFEVLDSHGVGGVIATNTSSAHSFEKGGLSGEPIFDRSYAFLQSASEILKGSNMELIACGGISKEVHIQKLRKLEINHFQIYSSFVYSGPSIIDKLLSY